MSGKLKVQNSQYDTLLVLDTVADHRELVACANRLGCSDPARIALFIAGSNVAAAGAELARETGLDVIACEHEQLSRTNSELLSELLRATVAELRPRLVCLFHTIGNCRVAASMAVVLGFACVTGVESCELSAEGPIFRRGVFNGKLLQTVMPATQGTIVTILPGAFRPDGADSAARRPEAACRVINSILKSTCTPLGIIPEPADETIKLEDADVVVAAGRGIGNRENLAVVEETARIFENATVAGSRPLCDLKWLPHSRQVGSTGRTIAPRLYLACGISGAQQHLAGIKGAQFTVAINTDPDAAIFAHADCIIVEDAVPFLRQLIRLHRQGRNRRKP